MLLPWHPGCSAYPRVVVAVDAQPASNSAPYLKDRLYIGYQEKSAVLEVISYNEAAGRFEFQLVKDYREGGRPQVVYANRTLCFACHQNGAPIFSRALWDETNANPQTAALLAASGHHFYGIPAERGVDIPYAVDNATERANTFALTQRLWRDGCGGDDPPARRCRAGLFAAALRHALSGGQAWVPDTNFEQTVAAPLRAEAGRRWPGGLLLTGLFPRPAHLAQDLGLAEHRGVEPGGHREQVLHRLVVEVADSAPAQTHNLSDTATASLTIVPSGAQSSRSNDSS